MDQCISSFECLDDLETIIDLVLKWSQDEEVLITPCKTIVCNVVDKYREIIKKYSTIPRKALLNRFIRYLICPEM